MRRAALLGLVVGVPASLVFLWLAFWDANELFRARWLAVAAPMPSGRALATVGLDRGSDVVTLFVFLVAALPFVASAAWVTRIAVGAAVLLIVLLTALFAARERMRAHACAIGASAVVCAVFYGTWWTRSPSRLGGGAWQEPSR